MATRTKKRKIAPCKDREVTYEMMSGWTFREVEKVYQKATPFSKLLEPMLSHTTADHILAH